jgi:NDP-sugar pyrophosphorylase family protein
VKALILAGGFATRLRPLSCTRPKQLFPIANKPLLDWIIENLEANGVEEIVIAINYMADVLRNHYDNHPPKARIIFSKEETPLGTAGPIKKAEPLLADRHKDPFIVINGDILSDINLKEMMKDHRENHALATLALKKVEDPRRFGVVDVDESGVIQKFVEKPTDGVKNKLINAGAYILDQEIFNLIPKENRKISIEREIFPTLARNGRMRGYVTESLWIDIGTPPDFLQANYIVLQSQNKNTYGRNTRIHPQAQIISPTVIGDNVTVEKGAVIGPLTVLGDNSSIGEGSSIEKSVIFPDCIVATHSTIKEDIIGEGVMIGNSVQIEKQTVVGDYCQVKDNLTLAKNVKICHSKELGESIPESCNIM